MYAIRSYYAIDDMLSKIAGIYEQQVDDAVDGLSSLIEPIIMAVLGVVVGGLVVAMYLPRITSYNVCYTKLLRISLCPTMRSKVMAG